MRKRDKNKKEEMRKRRISHTENTETQRRKFTLMYRMGRIRGEG